MGYIPCLWSIYLVYGSNASLVVPSGAGAMSLTSANLVLEDLRPASALRKSKGCRAVR